MDLQYTTIHRLRQEGFTTTELPDADALRLIKEASASLSDILGQWFVPVRSRKRLDGGGSSIVSFPNRIPFLEVFSLSEEFTAKASSDYLPSRMDILIGNTDGTVFPPSDFVIRGRFIELLYSRFFEGRGNVVIDAYSGFMDWFEQDSRNYSIKKVLSSLTADLNNDGTDCLVLSVNDFSVRDVILFEKNDTTRELLGIAIATSVDRTLNKISFDKIGTLNGQQIPTGSRVLTFGAVPRLIERATILLIKKLIPQINSDEYEEGVFGGKLKSEKTDRYSYTLYGGDEGGGVGITGDPLVDSQLAKFSEPHFVDFA